jgi:phytoene dehydrogenase-like protein
MRSLEIEGEIWVKKGQNLAKSWLIAVVSGLIGAVIGLLFAPKSGRETRARLKEKGGALKSVARQLTTPLLTQTQSISPLPRSHRYDYDAIIIGGGHNGLVTAAYLAKAGQKVLVLERRDVVGGAAVTEGFAAAPTFKFSTVADGTGYLSPQIIADLKLSQHGLEILPADPLIFAPQPDGSYLTIWRDLDRTAEEISRFSQKDAVRYPAFVKQVAGISTVVSSLMNLTPPHLPKPAPADLQELLKLLGPARKLSKKDIYDILRILPMSVADFLNEWFEAEPLRGIIAAQGVSGITWGPRAAGTAYMLLYASAGSGGELFGGSGAIKGGMGGLTQAIAGAAQAFGAEIRTGLEVAGIMLQESQARGVALANGEKLSAAAVISNADPRTTFLKLLGPHYLDPFFVRQVRNIKFRGSGARLHLALSGLPHFTALNGANSTEYLRGYIRIAPGLDYLEQAFDAAKYGDYARRPYLNVTIPSLADPTLAPAGHHVMSIYAQYAPYRLKTGSWTEKGEALAETIIETLAHYAPDLKRSILHRHLLTPLDLETCYGLPEGNPNHGEMTLDQFLYMRPVPGWAQYRTPIPGLYLCGAGTHPGGGVTGLPGKNAAREILRDWGR